jgi:predicted branched-subunit amino acid permease
MSGHRSSPGADPPQHVSWEQERASIRRDALGIAAYAGAFGVSLGAIAVSSGLTVIQTGLLSLAMFSGASQVAFVSVVGAGGSALTAIPAALLLGIRNTFYGIRLVQVLGVRGRRIPVAAQFVLDETTAMVIAREDQREQRYAFWFTGVLLFIVWNLGTIGGAVGGAAIGDTATLGLDAVVPAAFLALIWPGLDDRTSRLVAIGGALVASALVPVLPPGIPVLAAAPVAVVAGLWRRQRRSAQ